MDLKVGVLSLRSHAAFSASVLGLVGLLTDSSSSVQGAAIDALLSCVEENWHEIADGLAVIEGLAMNPKFSHHKKAALLASKIMYNLNMLDDAVMQAIAAEELFNTQEVSEYTHTVIAGAIERYCSDRQRLFEELSKQNDENLIYEVAHSSSVVLNARRHLEEELVIDHRLESLVERMVEESRKTGESGEVQALGVALESRRLDLLRNIIEQSSSASMLLRDCVGHSQTTVSSRRFRSLLQRLAVKLYTSLFSHADRSVLKREYTAIARTLALTDNYDKVAELLASLIDPKDETEQEEGELMAYQIAFDLVTFENQAFLTNLLNYPRIALLSEDNNIIVSNPSLPSRAQASSPLKDTDREEPTTPEAADSDDVKQPLLQHSSSVAEHTGYCGNSSDVNGVVTDVHSESGSLSGTLETGDSSGQRYATRVWRLRQILSGETGLHLTVNFLYEKNRSDLLLLDQIKCSVDPRSSVTQNAIVICHALMQCGTSCDVYIRENLDWFARSICWAKFVVAASTGVLHKGHITASRKVLYEFLAGTPGGPYSEGGALMAFGLIHANRFDVATRKYLLDQLQDAQSHCPENYEPLQHGACLGLGLLAMGSNDQEIHSTLRDILFADSAVSGEAAAIAMGMLALGSGSIDVASELLNTARDTEHERAVRGASLGAAFVVYRKEEEADPILDQMAKDKDPMVRYGGMFAIGLAYCGTSNRSALRRLLHVAVSDVSSDVRRAAVMALGFVACNSPNQVPRIVSLLADSFNPHVRYAAGLAIGVGCCGTASLAAVDMLLPLTQDTTDFVRQGALLGLGLVLVQASANALPDGKVQMVRDLIVRVAADKHEDTITRFGAIVSQGLIDAGGRNSTISFFSSTNALRPESAVGLALFCQLWFWYPLIVTVSLAFRATSLIGLTADLKPAPDFTLASTAPIGSFTYIEPVKQAKKEEKRAAITAVLTTASRRRQQEQIRKLAAAAAQDSSKARQEDVEMATAPAKPQDVSAGTENAVAGTQAKTEEEEEQQQFDQDDSDVIMSLSENAPLTEPQTEKPSAQQRPFTLLRNPCRVVPAQEEYIVLDVPESPWVPIDSYRRSGFVVLKRRDQFNTSDIATGTQITSVAVDDPRSAVTSDMIDEDQQTSTTQ